jgi:DNA polymerase sigma
MIKHLHQESNICNFHISTLNLERSTRLILEALNLHKAGEVRHDQIDLIHTNKFCSLFNQARFPLGYLFTILLVQNYGMNFPMEDTVIHVHQLMVKRRIVQVKFCQ